MMKASELTERLRTLSIEEQTAWMLRLGSQLTIAARSAYEAGTDQANGIHLRGFNEIQHRVYARLREYTGREEWTEESFVAMLWETSTHFGIAAEVAYAIERSLEF